MAAMVRVNGTSLFVDDRGPANAPALLFVHGGPGNSCWDFMTSVGDLLVDRGLRVIGVDQRGVLRSEPLPDQPALTTGVLADAAAVCRGEATAPHRLQFNPQVLAAMQQLGSDYLRLFTYDENGLTTYLALAEQAPTELDWTRGASHLPPDRRHVSRPDATTG